MPYYARWSLLSLGHVAGVALILVTTALSLLSTLGTGYRAFVATYVSLCTSGSLLGCVATAALLRRHSPQIAIAVLLARGALSGLLSGLAGLTAFFFIPPLHDVMIPGYFVIAGAIAAFLLFPRMAAQPAG